MLRPDSEIAPQAYARAGGILYLFVILAALFGEALVRGTLIVPGDAAATAHNILRSETLFRGGLAAEMFTCVCDAALAMILYALLAPVNRNVALLAAFLRLAFVALYSTAKVFEIAALALLGPAGALKAFDPKQLYAMAYLSLNLHGDVYGASLLFFGGSTLLFGCLMFRSTYLPRSIGALLIIAGAGYVVYSLEQMLSPAFTAARLFPWLLLPGFFAEVALALWLIARGVDRANWDHRHHVVALGT